MYESHSMYSKTAIAFMAMALAIMAMISSFLAFRSIYAPVVAEDAVIENENVKLGDIVVIAYTFNRRSYCRTEIDRFILGIDGTVRRRERLPAGTTKLGRQIVRAFVPTVVPARPWLGIYGNPMELMVGGEYVVREFIHSDCGDKLHTEMVPDVHFRIVE